MHRGIDQLSSDLDHILAAPANDGAVELIALRPAEDERVVVDSADLDTEEGLIGDSWRKRGNPHTADGLADPLAQVTLMSSRVAQTVAGSRDRWPLAGDQIYVDLDLSQENLPPGTRLQIGDAVIEVSSTPHTGCAKFAARFGREALRFVNVGVGRESRFRGMNTRVVKNGTVRIGDHATKLPADTTS